MSCFYCGIKPNVMYKANAMVNVNDEGRVGRKRDMFPRVAVADHCVTVIMQFLDRAWL